jgi:ATP-dependent DNA ligase
LELDGELYTHGMSFEEIASIVSRTANLHNEYENIEFHVFDVVNNNPQFDRIHELSELDLGETIVKAVEGFLAHDLDQVIEVYNSIIKQSYEGIIVRNFFAPYVRKRSTNVMKFKPKKSDYYKIIGYQQMLDKDGKQKEMLGALLLTSDEGTIFSVGSGMNDEFRRNNWPSENADKLIDKICHVEYQHITTGKGVPRFPVFVEILDL